MTGATSAVQNILRCCERAGLQVNDVVLESLASGEAVLDPEEKRLGVALVDLGGGTTDVAIFVDNAIRFTSVLALGGSNITSNISVGLRACTYDAFGVDHWYRFAKQRLYWTLPRLATPEQAERWSDLMPLMTWELWLAREIVTDQPLPWQKPQADLTSGRVCQSLGGVLAVIGTPAQPPKPRGKSPGWPKGRLRRRRERYPVVKKSRKRSQKAA